MSAPFQTEVRPRRCRARPLSRRAIQRLMAVPAMHVLMGTPPDTASAVTPTYGSSTILGSPGTATSSAVAKPTGVVDGSLVIVGIYLEHDGDVTPPAATTGTWYELANVDQNTSGKEFRFHVFWKIANTTESGGTYTFTHSSAWRHWACVRMEGPFLNPSNPIETLNIGVTTSNSATKPAVSATTGTNNNSWVWLSSHWDNGVATSPAGFSEREDNGGNVTIATLEQASAGASGSLTGSGTNSSHISVLIGVTGATPTSHPVPTWVAASTMVAADTGTTINATAPAGKANGDVLWLGVWANAADTISTPSNWNVGIAATSNANISRALFWRYADGSGDDTPTITFSTTATASHGHYCRIWGIRGCLQGGTPYDTGSPVIDAPAANTTPDTAALQPRGLNRLLLAIVLADDDNTWSSGMPPSTWTNAGPIATSTTGADAMSDGIYKALTNAIAHNPVVIGTMSASDSYVTYSMSMIPA